MGKKGKGASITRTQTVPELPLITPRSDFDHKDQVQCETIIDDQIFVVNHLFTQTNAERYLRFFKDEIEPHMSQPTPPRRGEAKRTSERWSMDSSDYAHRLFHETGLDEVCMTLNLVNAGPQGLKLKGLNSNIRVYRYKPGCFFDYHYDDEVKDPSTKFKSAWTLLIYITEGKLDGGETEFQMNGDERNKPILLAPPVSNGMALLHRHGRDCLLHRGNVVKAGIKWVLRSDLMFG